MSPQSTSSDNKTIEETEVTTSAITTSNPTKIKPGKSPREQAKNTAITFVKSGVFVAIALIIFHWANFNYKVGDKLSKVNTEVWIGIVVTIATTYWQWYSEKEKEKLKAAQARAAENTATIKSVSDTFQALVTKLDGRVSSVMVQIAQIRGDMTQLTADIEGLKRGERTLDQKIDDNRYEVLRERFDLLKSFSEEICQLHASISYMRGFREGDRPVSVDKLNTILEEVASQVRRLEDIPSDTTQTQP